MSYAKGQSGSESNAPITKQDKKDAEIRRLQVALNNALDKIEQLQAEKKAAEDALEAAKQAIKDAENALAAGKLEREAYERVIAYQDKAITNYQSSVAALEKALAAEERIALLTAEELVKSKERERSANRRAQIATGLLVVLGLILSLRRLW